MPTRSLLDSPVLFVDVETTGGHPARHRVIELGLVAATGAKLEYEWSTLINPGVPIPFSIQQFTGITDEMVRRAPFFEDIADEIAEHLEGRLFIAHNARFDYGFLRHELRRTGRRLANRMACTVKLSRRLYPQMSRHNLDALIERHGLECAERHRALADARALWQFWQVVRAERAHAEFEQALMEIVSLQSLPAHLPPELADELPESCGVYRFYGEGGALLYVGKAKNIRQRVLSHWQSAMSHSRSQRLTELTRQVEWVETAGELGALLLEARLVRELRPLFNRRLRGSAQVWTWVIADDGAPPELAPLDQAPLSFAGSDTFGVFRTEALARKTLVAIAREQRLCLKVLGLETTSGSCFAHQLARCAGACVGAEPLSRHAARVKLALAPHRLKSWPFAGPVGVREARENGYAQVHVIDHWRHLATLQEGDALPRRRPVQPFDIDVYRILTRYLSSAPRLQIIELSADLDAA